MGSININAGQFTGNQGTVILNSDKPGAARDSATSTGRSVHPRLTPNMFGIPFGLAGLAQAWTTWANLFHHGAVAADALWIVSAASWLLLTAIYLRDVLAGRRLREELADPVYAPFVALVFIVPMMLGVALAGVNRSAGVTVFFVALGGTVGIGGWLYGEWILTDIRLIQWHPGYFLPTVAGGYLASAGSAALGYRQFAAVMFGYGTLAWLVLGSILLGRLFTEPMLPVPLRPTMAIQVAPPAVAGTAWFAINGGRIDTLALCLAGYAALMIIVQLRLAPAYRAVPFGPSWWAFSFSYAAVFVYGLHWLDAASGAGADICADALLATVTVGIAVLVVRTLSALARRTFLPSPQSFSQPDQHPSTKPNSTPTAEAHS